MDLLFFPVPNCLCQYINSCLLDLEADTVLNTKKCFEEQDEKEDQVDRLYILKFTKWWFDFFPCEFF